ncbi:hypothetical protein LEP1GSC170_1423 [Leptospira interrogans serovar Bataviae str. HAI135]|nr:hypothetical protein LEP1GSC170_1423 [Leptospira interrogans serovar Bataviae str. HAI135]
MIHSKVLKQTLTLQNFLIDPKKIITPIQFLHKIVVLRLLQK